MSKIFTPARTTAAIGVLTGLVGVATSLTGVVDVHSALGQALVALGGYFTTGISVFKFLEGQAGWEQQQSEQTHYAAITALSQVNAKPAPLPEPTYALDDPESAPIDAVADQPEPERLSA